MNTEARPQLDAAEVSGDDAPSPGGLKETLLLRLRRCVERLENPELRPGWVIHEVRKDLKRSRALLRLAEQELPTRRLEKRCGSAARRLSALRDADAAGETIARLRERADARQLVALDELAEWLPRQIVDLDGEPGLPRPIAMKVSGSLRKVAGQLESMSFESVDAAALDRGLAASWQDTDSAFRRIMDKPKLIRFHAFRKTVKRELYQRELSGRPLDRMERATLKKLADVLGELQDLDVLRATMRSADCWRGPVRRLVKQTMRELKGRAIRLGGGRYPEKKS